MKTYQVWSVGYPMEYIEALTGWEARKQFAIKHRLSITDVMSRVWTKQE